MDVGNEPAGHEPHELTSERVAGIERAQQPALAPVLARGRERSGVGLWVLWLLGTVAGGFVSLQVAGVDRVRVGGLAEWAAAGAGFGLAQLLSLALGRYASKITLLVWVPASALGLAAGPTVAAAWIAAMPGGLNVPGAPVVNSAIPGAIALGAVGFAQALVLLFQPVEHGAQAWLDPRPNIGRAGWWVLANVVAGAMLQPIIILITLQHGNVLYRIFAENAVDTPQFGNSAGQVLAAARTTGQIVAFAVAGAITGFALVRLLRQPRSVASGIRGQESASAVEAQPEPLTPDP